MTHFSDSLLNLYFLAEVARYMIDLHIARGYLLSRSASMLSATPRRNPQSSYSALFSFTTLDYKNSSVAEI
jgi:hypothetical protein